MKFCTFTIFIVTGAINIISATPQLDIDSLTAIENPKHFHTNGHSNKAAIISSVRDQSNEVVVDDTLRFDRDRSQRYGPPYTDGNDRRYYSNNNNDENFNSRPINRHLEDQSEINNDDDEDKYHNEPRSPYYISEKQRNQYGYRDYYSTVRSN